MGSCPLRILLLALGALAIYRSGLKAALFQPARDLVFREAEVRFDPYVRNQSALGIAINRAVHLASVLGSGSS
jgi:hypothetical protein